MSYPNIPFRSYCWSFGTTSFRTKKFNSMIEKQLMLLNEFWKLPQNKGQSWTGNSLLQSSYYDFLLENSFLNTVAKNKAKDARQKTSGLEDMGLITAERTLTEVGMALLGISESGDFSSDNLLGIPKDSFIFLKQMLKTTNQVDFIHVRPFIVLIYLLSKLDYLTNEEATYLLPLCVDEESTEFILSSILKLRKNEVSVNDVLINRIMSMENYKAAYDLLLKNEVSEELIKVIGMNRKSRSYDLPYYNFYLGLKKVFLHNKEDSIENLYELTGTLKLEADWRALLFNTTSSQRTVKKDPQGSLCDTRFSNINDEDELKEHFFKFMHLFKVKATLYDYFDLNRRYIKNTDTILFQDGKLVFDIIPKQLFHSIADTLYKDAYTENENLDKNITLEQIDSSMAFTATDLIDAVNTELGISATNIEEARQAIDDERYERLDKLIKERFSDNDLVELLNLLEKRDDKEIFKRTTDNAEIPTIFEYILGIIWYKLSDRKGKVLDYIKLSLEADLLPKSHAIGGDADIVYKYEACDAYPEHSVLLEATLTKDTNQRRAEMEPVSRHLGQHLLKSGNSNSYAVFATTDLNINVISDFRNKKTATWYDTHDYSKFVEGMKIIPLQTSELKEIVKNQVKYKDLYVQFEEAYQSELPPHQWYEECIKNKGKSI